MKQESSMARRQFLKTIPAAGATLTASVYGAPAIISQRNTNDVIGIGCIGVGTQGHYLLQYAQAVPNTEVRIICDLYEGNRQRARKLSRNKLMPPAKLIIAAMIWLLVIAEPKQPSDR